MDLGASAGPEAYERGLRVLLGSGEVDSVLVIYAALLDGEAAAITAAIRRAAASTPDIPLAAALLGTRGDPAPPQVEAAGQQLPVYQFPESAVRALAHAARHAEWRRRPSGPVPRLSDVDADAARSLVAAMLAERPEGGWLAAADATRLVAAFGIPVCPTLPARTPEEAVRAATELGYPVVLKTGGHAVHKTDRGGVRLNLRTDADVCDAFGPVAAAAEDPADGVIVQPRLEPGLELLVGINRVHHYPPLVVVGLGGTSTELLADRTTRIGPLTELDAHDALRELRAAPLLSGYRGRPPLDVPAVEDLLLRVGLLADEVPELAELDLNPVITTQIGATAVDVKIRLSPIPLHDQLLNDPLVRHLR